MGKAYYIIPIFVPHVGCPHDCVFCNQNTITGNREKQDITGEKVREIIEEYLKTIDYKNSTVEISFFGGTFTGIPIEKQRELLKVAKEYKDRNIIKYIRMSTRPDYINDEILTHLKSFNADIIELGVQSLDEEVLTKSGRGHSKFDVQVASKLIKEYGFTLGHQVMLGLPWDDEEKDIKTALESVSMKPDICRIYPALTIKNTPMEKMFNDGVYEPYSLSRCVEICKDVYNIYHANDVKIIRVGLQPTEDINEGAEVIAGPFHPAFRELVESSLINEMLLYYISGLNLKEFNIKVNPKVISKLYANKKQYFNEMKKRLNSNNLKVIQDEELGLNQFKIQYGENSIIIDWHEYLNKRFKEKFN